MFKQLFIDQACDFTSQQGHTHQYSANTRISTEKPKGLSNDNKSVCSQTGHSYISNICQICSFVDETSNMYDQRVYIKKFKDNQDFHVQSRIQIEEFVELCKSNSKSVLQTIITQEELQTIIQQSAIQAFNITQSLQIKGNKPMKLYLYIMSTHLKQLSNKQILEIVGLIHIRNSNKWFYQGHKILQLHVFGNPQIETSIEQIDTQTNCKDDLMLQNIQHIQEEQWIFSTHTQLIQEKLMITIAFYLQECTEHVNIECSKCLSKRCSLLKIQPKIVKRYIPQIKQSLEELRNLHQP